MNRSEIESEIKDLGFIINHDKITLEKELKRLQEKVKEPNGLVGRFVFGYYDKRIQMVEKRLEKQKQLEARLSRIIQRYHYE